MSVTQSNQITKQQLRTIVLPLYLVITIFFTISIFIGCGRKIIPPPPPIQPVVGYRQIGIASWYGSDFHGKPTASGEIYNMYDLTAAHKTLPLGTQVMVTNLENNRSVKVIINDRGPFVKNRIIDLSYAAAKEIGMVGPGIAKVMIEVLRTPSKKITAPLTPPALYTLQVASFINKDNADRLAANLSNLADNVYIVIYKTGQTTYYRVRIGIFESREQAIKEGERITKRGYNVLITDYEQ